MGMALNIEDLPITGKADKLAKDNELPLPVVLSQAKEIERKGQRGQSVADNGLAQSVQNVKDSGKHLPPAAPGADRSEKAKEEKEEQKEVTEQRNEGNAQQLQMIIRGGASESLDYSR